MFKMMDVPDQISDSIDDIVFKNCRKILMVKEEKIKFLLSMLNLRNWQKELIYCQQQPKFSIFFELDYGFKIEADYHPDNNHIFFVKTEFEKDCKIDARFKALCDIDNANWVEMIDSEGRTYYIAKLLFKEVKGL